MHGLLQETDIPGPFLGEAERVSFASRQTVLDPCFNDRRDDASGERIEPGETHVPLEEVVEHGASHLEFLIQAIDSLDRELTIFDRLLVILERSVVAVAPIAQVRESVDAQAQARLRLGDEFLVLKRFATRPQKISLVFCAPSAANKPIAVGVVELALLGHHRSEVPPQGDPARHIRVRMQRHRFGVQCSESSEVGRSVVGALAGNAEHEIDVQIADPELPESPTNLRCFGGGIEAVRTSQNVIVEVLHRQRKSVGAAGNHRLEHLRIAQAIGGVNFHRPLDPTRNRERFPQHLRQTLELTSVQVVGRPTADADRTDVELLERNTLSPEDNLIAHGVEISLDFEPPLTVGRGETTERALRRAERDMHVQGREIGLFHFSPGRNDLTDLVLVR